MLMAPRAVRSAVVAEGFFPPKELHTEMYTAFVQHIATHFTVSGQVGAELDLHAE